MSHTAVIELRQDPKRAVVVDADPVIWLSPEILAAAFEPGAATVAGGLERDGDRITFGTPGEGLGRLTYRLVGEHWEFGQYKVHVAERVQPGADQ